MHSPAVHNFFRYYPLPLLVHVLQRYDNNNKRFVLFVRGVTQKGMQDLSTKFFLFGFRRSSISVPSLRFFRILFLNCQTDIVWNLLASCSCAVVEERVLGDAMRVVLLTPPRHTYSVIRSVRFLSPSSKSGDMKH